MFNSPSTHLGHALPHGLCIVIDSLLTTSYLFYPLSHILLLSLLLLCLSHIFLPFLILLILINHLLFSLVQLTLPPQSTNNYPHLGVLSGWPHLYQLRLLIGFPPRTAPSYLIYFTSLNELILIQQYFLIFSYTIILYFTAQIILYCFLIVKLDCITCLMLFEINLHKLET